MKATVNGVAAGAEPTGTYPSLRDGAGMTNCSFVRDSTPFADDLFGA